MVKYAISELKEKPVADLRIIAKKVCGTGVSKMKKADLISHITNNAEIKKTPKKSPSKSKSPRASPKKAAPKRRRVAKKSPSKSASPRASSPRASPKRKRVVRRPRKVPTIQSSSSTLIMSPPKLVRPKGLKTYKPRKAAVVRKTVRKTPTKTTTSTIVISPSKIVIPDKKVRKSVKPKTVKPRKSIRKSTRSPTRSATRSATRSKSPKGISVLKPKTRKIRKSSTTY